MPFHACYRIVAGVDMILSILTAVLWWIFFRRTETLINLQFETNFPAKANHSHSLNESSKLAEDYRVLIPSVGSHHSDQDSLIILHEYYGSVQNYCSKAYNESSIKVPQDNKKRNAFKAGLTKKTRILISCVFVAVGCFLMLDALMINSTKHGGATNGTLIGVILFLYLLTLCGYGIAAFWLHFDPKFCAHNSDLRPLTPVIIAASGLVKPLQLYVICRYRCDVARGIYLEEEDSEMNLELLEEPTAALAQPVEGRKSGLLEEVRMSISTTNEPNPKAGWMSLLQKTTAS